MTPTPPTPTHRCDSCDTYYFAPDVPKLCDNCERGVPVPAGVKAPPLDGNLAARLKEFRERHDISWSEDDAALVADLAAAAGVKATCGWQEQDPDGCMPGTYESACGEMWSFTEGGVKENHVRFCQGCGKPVEVVPFPEPIDEDAAAGVDSGDGRKRP